MARKKTVKKKNTIIPALQKMNWVEAPCQPVKKQKKPSHQPVREKRREPPTSSPCTASFPKFY